MTGMDNIALVERYRPDTLDEIIGQDDIVGDMEDYVEDSSMPNLLFAGPAGTGKTAIATALGKERYGDDFKQNFYEFNASDDRGIDVVRGKIKEYAREHPTPGYDFKIVFLDEADSLTKEAQAALRRVMENYHDRTRFILSCNYANKLIDPIQSRCSDYQVQPLDDEKVELILTNILDGEDFEYDLTDVAEIVRQANGDARSAINTLQAAVVDGELDGDKIGNLNTSVDYDKIEEIADLALHEDVDEAMDEMIKVVKMGYDNGSIAKAFMSVLRSDDELPDDSRMKTIDMLGECEYRILDGADPHIQWNAFLAKLAVAPYMSVGGYKNQ